MPADAKDVVDPYRTAAHIESTIEELSGEVIRLRLTNQRLREALRPFAELPDGILNPHPCLTRCWRVGEATSLDDRGRCVECGAHTRGADEHLDSPSPTYDEIRAARSALEESVKE